MSIWGRNAGSGSSFCLRVKGLLSGLVGILSSQAWDKDVDNLPQMQVAAAALISVAIPCSGREPTNLRLSAIARETVEGPHCQKEKLLKRWTVIYWSLQVP